MSSTVVDFIHDLTWDDLPAPVIVHAKRCLLDLLGVAVGGSTTSLSKIIRDHAVDQFGAGRQAAKLMFDGRIVSPAGAALAGGMTIDALDAHDGLKIAKGHVGCGVLPSLLAFVEAEGLLDGGDFLAALVLGYEIGSRAGEALHETAADYHTSGAWVALAAAALGARVLGLSAEATLHALGIAEYHGPRSLMMRCVDHPTMVKDGSGWGAMAGVSAAYLAASGFTGAPADTVVGERLAPIWSNLGSRWRMEEQYFKLYPVCRWAQPPVEAVLALTAAHSIGAGDIAEIEVVSFHEAIRLASVEPKTTEEAQYSTPFSVASAVAKGWIGPEEVGDGALTDPEVLRVSRAVRLTHDPAYDTAFPERRFAHVVLTLQDGTVLSSPTVEARGDPEAPLSASEVVDKYHRFADPIVGVDRADAIRRWVEDLEPEIPMGALLADISAPIGPNRPGSSREHPADRPVAAFHVR